MNHNLTHIAFILDRSGSMDAMAKDTISSFNTFIEMQIKKPGLATLSLSLFNNDYSPLITSAELTDIPPLTKDTYIPRGTTALLDAMGRTINDLAIQLTTLSEEEYPGQVMVVTLTDGYDNASLNYTHERVAQMIQHQRDIYNWQFLFLGLESKLVDLAKKLKMNAQAGMQC
jgi:Mg-chelatase subunit ChlD